MFIICLTSSLHAGTRRVRTLCCVTSTTRPSTSKTSCLTRPTKTSSSSWQWHYWIITRVVGSQWNYWIITRVVGSQWHYSIITRVVGSQWHYWITIIIKKRSAMQGREREIDTLSVRRPQPHTTNL